MNDTECPTCEHYACGRECECDCERARLILARAEAAEARYAALVAALPRCGECGETATQWDTASHGGPHYRCEQHADYRHDPLPWADAVRA